MISLLSPEEQSAGVAVKGHVCSTCKFWDQVQNTEVGTCESGEFKFHGDDCMLADQVLLVKGIGKSGHLLFGPNFGCVHHQPADA